jgi:hypothetical protein
MLGKLQRRNLQYKTYNFRFGRGSRFPLLWKRMESMPTWNNPPSDLVLATMTQSDASLDVSFRDPSENEGPEVTMP